MKLRTERDQFEVVQPVSFEPHVCLPAKLHHRCDDARYLVGLILRKLAVGDTDHGAVLLSAKFLGNVIAKDDAKAVIDSLIEREAITRDYYRPGERCFGYRLHDRFKGDSHCRVPLTDRRLCRALSRWHSEYRAREEAKFEPVHKHLRDLQWQLAIDRDQAQAALDALPGPQRAFDLQSILVRDLERHRMHFSLGQYGRVANSITGLSRSVRPALRHKGEPLVCLDLKNAQPAFVASAVRDRTRTTTKPCIYDSENCPPDGSASTELYCKLTQEGRWYEYLRKSCGEATFSRDDIKKRFLTDVLACRPVNKRGKLYPSLVRSTFEAAFPEVWAFIRETNKKDHATLIRALQRAESSLVIGSVCERLRVHHPDRFVITLHDAIYSTERTMPIVEQGFLDAFQEQDFKLHYEIKAA